MKKPQKGQKYTKEQALELVEKCYDSGEPVFIIRGRDTVSWKAVKSYAETLKNAALGEGHASPAYNVAEDAELFATTILYWQGANLEKVKLPD